MTEAGNGSAEGGETPQYAPAPTLTSARLVLRQLMPEDREAYCALYRAPHMLRWEKFADDRLETLNRHFDAVFHMGLRDAGDDPGSFGFAYAICRKTDEAFVGVCLAWPIKHPGSESFSEARLGIAVAQACWGEGYGTEACETLMHFLFGRGLRRMSAECYEGNKAIVRLLTKLGMRPKHRGFWERRIVPLFGNTDYREMYWDIGADAWHARQRRTEAEGRAA